MNRFFKRALVVAFFASVYFCAGKIGLSLALLNASASAVWPPTGLALAALLIWGIDLWPGIFIGAFLVNYSTQGSVPASLAIAAGNTLEAIAATWLVRRFAGGLRVFDRTPDLLKYIALAGLFSTTISATIGVTTLGMAGFATWPQYGSIWLTWWLGDTVSNLVFAPLIILWVTKPRVPSEPRALVEVLAVASAISATAVFLFFASTPLALNHYPLEHLAVLPLLWAAFRLGPRAAVTFSALTSFLAIRGTLAGFGPFSTASPNTSLLLLQAFIGTITLTVLVVACLIQDRKAHVTDLLETQEALTQAQKKLQEHATGLEATVADRTAQLQGTVEELEAFSYSLSHDMRAPLRAIQSFTEIVLSDGADQLSPQIVGYLKRVISSAKRMDRLIQDVLSFAKISRQEIIIHEVQVEALLRQIISERPELQPPAANITIQTPLLTILGHEASLTQCLTNILGNGVKFVAPGVHPELRVWTEPRGRRVRLWIQDNGIGIDKNSQTKLFGMFQRLDNPVAKYEGTGIGLAIVRKAIERMNGQVGIESELGKGSRFWLELDGPNEPESA